MTPPTRSTAEHFEHAVRAREPLIIRRGCARWRIARTWTRAHLAAAEREGTCVDVHLVRAGGLSGAAGEEEVTRMEFGAQFLHAEPLAPAGAQLYLAQCDLAELPRLAREAPAVPRFARAVTVARGAAPARLLWINRGAVRSRMHYDGYDSLLCVLRGRKRLQLLPPRAAAAGLIAPAAAHGLSPNQLARSAVLAGRALARARPYECTLEAGDVLFIPRGWWHQVGSAAETVALSFAFACAADSNQSQPLAPLADELSDDACGAAYLLREAARALVRRELRRRLASAAARARRERAAELSAPPRADLGPCGCPSQRVLALGLLARSHARRGRRAGLIAASCARGLAAALCASCDGWRRPAGAARARWLRSLGPLEACALVAALEREARGEGACCGAACAHATPRSTPSLAAALFESDSDEACSPAGSASGSDAREPGARAQRQRAFVIRKADRLGDRLCRRLITRALGLGSARGDRERG